MSAQHLAARAAALVLAQLAKDKIDGLSQPVEQVLTDAGISQRDAVQVNLPQAVARAVTQDRALVSKRVWESALPLLSTIAYALLDPSLVGAFVQWLQAHPGAWWGVAANIVAVVLPIVSKALDPRPVRPDGT